MSDPVSEAEIQRSLEGTPDNFNFTADPKPPNANVFGWKETVRMNPNEVTTVIMQFNFPKLPTADMRNAVSPRTGGKGVRLALPHPRAPRA